MAESADDVVRCETADGVALLTLNRPEHNNGWNPDLEVRYFDLLGALDEDPDVRVIVVTGAGRTFCPGVDMAYFAARSRGEGPR
jgi:enoyl-CoA hydratase/carnithine racemase